MIQGALSGKWKAPRGGGGGSQHGIPIMHAPLSRLTSYSPSEQPPLLAASILHFPGLHPRFSILGRVWGRAGPSWRSEERISERHQLWKRPKRPRRAGSSGQKTGAATCHVAASTGTCQLVPGTCAHVPNTAIQRAPRLLSAYNDHKNALHVRCWCWSPCGATNCMHGCIMLPHATTPCMRTPCTVSSRPKTHSICLHYIDPKSRKSGHSKQAAPLIH